MEGGALTGLGASNGPLPENSSGPRYRLQYLGNENTPSSPPPRDNVTTTATTRKIYIPHSNGYLGEEKILSSIPGERVQIIYRSHAGTIPVQVFLDPGDCPSIHRQILANDGGGGV